MDGFAAACDGGQAEEARRLIAQGADPNTVDSGFPVLVSAAQEGHDSVVSVLIAAGARVDDANEDGATALLMAAQGGHDSVVSVLIAAGARFDDADEDGATPLSLAALHGCAEVVKMLLVSRADPGSRMRTGDTPLHSAVFGGHAEVSLQLLQAGSDPSATTNPDAPDGLGGMTPLDYAQHKGHDAIAALLRNKDQNADLVAQFSAVTGADATTTARDYVQQADGDLSLAPEAFFDAQRAPAPIPEGRPPRDRGRGRGRGRGRRRGAQPLQLDAETDTDVRILLAFYQREEPESATEARVSKIIRSYRRKAKASGQTDWRELMYSAFIEARGTDPRDYYASLDAEPHSEPEPEPEPETEPEPELEPGSLADFFGSSFAILESSLEEFGVEELQDLTELQEQHIEQLVSKLKVVQANKLRKKIAALTGVDVGAPSSLTAAPSAAPLVQPDMMHKYVSATKQIRLGKASDAAHGIKALLGLSDTHIAAFLQDPHAAISNEFATHGTDEDRANLHHVLSGTKMLTWTTEYSMDDLVAHPDARQAKLGRHHVLALRLYTTSSYPRINDPLRADPLQRPHPFGATTYFISEAIKMLRAVAAARPDAYTEKILYRGMKDLGITAEFMQKGGTDFACVSTTANEQVAVKNFAASSLPLVFRVVSKNCMNRGADISFLSVFPKEEEYLYPPLSYLSCLEMKTEILCGVNLLVATVEPTIA